MLDYGSKNLPAQHRKAFKSPVEPFGVYLTLLACFSPSFRPDTVCRVSIDAPSFEIVCSDQRRVQVVGFYKRRAEWKRWIYHLKRMLNRARCIKVNSDETFFHHTAFGMKLARPECKKLVRRCFKVNKRALLLWTLLNFSPFVPPLKG